MSLRLITTVISLSIYTVSILFYSNFDYKPEPFISLTASKVVKKHKALHAGISLSTEPHTAYASGKKEALVNGITGSDKQFKDNQWVGFQGEDVEMVIDLKKRQPIKNVVMRFFNAEKEWIYAPKTIYFLFSDNGKQYRGIQRVDLRRGPNKVITMKKSFQNTKARYIKMMVVKYGKIPRGKKGAGKQAWTFLDEVQVW